MPEIMYGADLRKFRESKGWDQQEFADRLNVGLDRRYDKAKISRWETGAERIPQVIVQYLKANFLSAVSIPTASLGPSLAMAVINQKGGVAKTVSVCNLAYLLAQSGKRVLVIDCDAQGSATAHFGVFPGDPDARKQTLYHVLFEHAAIEDAIIPVCDDMIDLLPAGISLSRADAHINGQGNGALILRAKLTTVKNNYDFILLDCPPHLGQITTSALNAADLVLIPSQTETLSLMGIPLLLETLAQVQTLVNPNIRVLGLLPTQFDPRRTQDRERLSNLHELGQQNGFRVFEPVHRAVIYTKGVNEGVPALALDPQATSRESYLQVAQAMIEALNKHRGVTPAVEPVHG